MTLKAIIIRLEGALLETDEIERQAFLRLMEELANPWPCERSDFLAIREAPTRAERLALFVQRKLQAGARADDVPVLIATMQRRLGSHIRDVGASSQGFLRSGMRDLVLAANCEDIRVAVVSSSMPAERKAQIESALGPVAEKLDCVVGVERDGEFSSRVYAAALSGLGLQAEECLAIEGCAAGLKEAREAGIGTLVVRSAYAVRESFEDAIYVIDTLPRFLKGAQINALGPLTADERAELIAVLQRLHAGIVDLDGILDRSQEMKVSEILKNKGSEVKSITGGESIWALANRLRSDSIGALVVMRPDGGIDGIISERDIARGLAEHGSILPSKLVSDLMTRTVITCSPDDSVSGISRVMTQRRIRHLPVVENGKVVGLISIGDVLSHRLDQMQKEVNVLRDYAIAKS